MIMGVREGRTRLELGRSLPRELSLVVVAKGLLGKEGLRSLLEKTLGFRVVGDAENTRDAMALLRQCRPDVVICGIALPDLNPAELARALVEELQLDLPILVVTGNDTPSAIIEVLRSPVRGYLLRNETSTEALLFAIHCVSRGLFVHGPGVMRIARQNLVLRSTLPTFPLPVAALTAREREVLKGLAEGLTNKEIGKRLSLSTRTVQIHLGHLFTKLGVHTRVQAAVRAVQLPPHVLRGEGDPDEY